MVQALSCYSPNWNKSVQVSLRWVEKRGEKETEVFEQVKVCGLCGSDEIQAIECNRVKQTPFKAYIMRPFYRVENRLERVLNDRLPPPILIRLKKMKEYLPNHQVGHNLRPQEVFMSKFSLNDFRVDATCPKYCLDLYGICTKAED